MKLLLTSEGFTNKSIIEAFKSLAGRPFSELKVAFVPTAANAEKGDKSWLIDQFLSCKKLGFKEIDIVDISALSQQELFERLGEADIFVFSGGNTFYLIYWLQKSGLKDRIGELLEKRIYVGISAGSMVAANKLLLNQFQKLYFENMGELDNEDGLGLVDFNVFPHFNSENFPEVIGEKISDMVKNTNMPVYAVDDNTAIKVDVDKVEVISEGKWEKFN